MEEYSSEMFRAEQNICSTTVKSDMKKIHTASGNDQTLIFVFLARHESELGNFTLVRTLFKSCAFPALVYQM